MNDMNHMYEAADEPAGECWNGVNEAMIGQGHPLGAASYGGWVWSTLGRRRMRKDELAAEPKPLTERLVRDDGQTQVYQRSDGVMSAYTYDGAKEASDQPMLDRDQAERTRAQAAMGISGGVFRALGCLKPGDLVAAPHAVVMLINQEAKQLVEETCGISDVMRGASANANCRAEDDYYAKMAQSKLAALQASSRQSYEAILARVCDEVFNSERYLKAYEQAFLRQSEQTLTELYAKTGARPALPALPAHYRFDDVGARTIGRAQRFYISIETGEVLHTVWQADIEDWPELTDGAPWGTFKDALSPDQYKKVLREANHPQEIQARAQNITEMFPEQMAAHREQMAAQAVQRAATQLAEQASGVPPGSVEQIAQMAERLLKNAGYHSDV